MRFYVVIGQNILKTMKYAVLGRVKCASFDPVFIETDESVENLPIFLKEKNMLLPKNPPPTYVYERSAISHTKSERTSELSTMSNFKKMSNGSKFSGNYVTCNPSQDVQDLMYSSRSKEDNKFKFRVGKDILFPSFARAIERGDSKMIDKALSLPPIRVEVRDMMTGTSVLHVAARYPHGSLDKLLKHHHIKGLIDAPDNKGATPLIVAVWNENIEAVRVLLNNGAKTKCRLHESGQTAFHVASALKVGTILEELLMHDGSPIPLNWHDKYGDTPLLLSIEFDTPNTKALMKSGASHLAKNKTTERNVLHLAILNQRRDLLKMLLHEYPETQFISARDAHGDSPLKLAYQLNDAQSAMLLLQTPAGKTLVAEFPDVMLRTIEMGHVELFELVLSLSDVDRISNCYNNEGDSALIVAAKQGQIYMVEKLLRMGVKIKQRKNDHNKPIFDVANIEDARITKLILDANIDEIVKASDEDIKITYENVLRRGALGNFIVFQQSGLFDEKIRTKFESPLLAAARKGNYGAFLYLLLSNACSNMDWIRFNSAQPSLNTLMRHFLKKKIYASDLYVLTGQLPDNPKWNFCPSQGHLFENNAENRNIFHGCALGGCINMVIFAYRYCRVFCPSENGKLDEPDASGSTPLLLAILSRNKDVATFLIQKGANLIKSNNMGKIPINSLTKHIPGHKAFLINAMTQCIVSEEKAPNHALTCHRRFAIHFHILCPKDVNHITDVAYAISSFSYFKYQEVLCHPLMDYFVWNLWEKVGPMMKMRFYIGCISTLLFSFYLTMKYCDVTSPTIGLLTNMLWWLSLWSAKTNLMFHLPLYTIESTLMRSLVLKSNVFIPMIVIAYLFLLDGEDRTSLEVGGTAALGSWVSILFHGVASPMSEQISTFWIVLKEMCRTVPTFLIVTLAFTLYFFTLYNGFLTYNNPLHAFLFTAYQIPQGYVDKVPSLYQSTEEHTRLNRSYDYKTQISNDTVTHPEFGFPQVHTILVEGVTVMFYLFMASSLTNMLTTLAIRRGEEHLVATKAKTLANKMVRIHEWEKFFNGSFHNFLSTLKALWVVGVHPNAKETFVVPRVVRPVKTAHGFDIDKVKHYLTDAEDLISNREIPYLLRVLELESNDLA